MYEKRKAFLVSKLTREKEILSNKARFILMVVQEELELRKKKKVVLLKELQKLGFKPMSELNAIMKGGIASEGDDGDAEVEKSKHDEEDAEKSDYDYLLGMNLWSLTFEKVEQIKKLLDAKKQELEHLERTAIEEMWDADLQAVSAALDEVEIMEENEAALAATYAEGRKRKGNSRRPPTPATANAKPHLDQKQRCQNTEDHETLLLPLQNTAPFVSTWTVSEPIARRTVKASGLLAKPPVVNAEFIQGISERGVHEKVHPAVVGKEKAQPVDVDADPEVVVDVDVPLKAKRSRRLKPTTSAVSSDTEMVPPRPQEAASGAGLLERLLHRSGEMVQPRRLSNTSSHSHFESFSKSNDLFSYMRPDPTTDMNKPFNALDFGVPQNSISISKEPVILDEDAGSGKGTPDSALTSSGKIVDQPARRGRGRGRGRGGACRGGRGGAQANAQETPFSLESSFTASAARQARGCSANRERSRERRSASPGIELGRTRSADPERNLGFSTQQMQGQSIDIEQISETNSRDPLKLAESEKPFGGGNSVWFDRFRRGNTGALGRATLDDNLGGDSVMPGPRAASVQGQPAANLATPLPGQVEYGRRGRGRLRRVVTDDDDSWDEDNGPASKRHCM